MEAAVVVVEVIVVEVVVAVVVVVKKVYREYLCWFVTSVLQFPIMILFRRLDASEKFVMCTFQETIIHSNQKALHSLSMPILIRHARHGMRWIVFVSRDVN